MKLLLTMVALGMMLLGPTVALAQEERERVDVALDPGHSRVDVGAVGGGLREYELTLDLAIRVERYLQALGRTVRLTRLDHAPVSAMDNRDATTVIRLEQEARIEVGQPARVYVSLHFNAGAQGLRGTETYYNEDRAAEAPVEDRTLARAVQGGVLAALAEDGYPSVDRGAKSDLVAGKPYGHFFSLRGPVPSALLEALFLSQPGDAGLAADEAVRETIARGCAAGIDDYLAGAAERSGAAR